jgi:hypothetical protein
MSVPEISTLLPVLTARRSVELNANTVAAAAHQRGSHGGGGNHMSGGGGAGAAAVISEAARNQLEAAQHSVVKVLLYI